MRPRAHSYRNLDGLTTDRDAVPWYWRLVAFASNLLILGGFLMLPATFDTDDQLRVSRPLVGIFGVAILTAGFSLTGLLCFATRHPSFQADSIFLPALTSCAIGLLTIFYSFLISLRYVWNTQALLLTVAAAVSTITYTALLIYTHRKISLMRARPSPIPLVAQPENDTVATSYQSPSFYENYVRNMYPASTHPSATGSPGFDPNFISEEDMQRQQMLMLLLQKEQPPTPDPSQSTFHIDWQEQEQDETPVQGYYAPSAAIPRTAHPFSADSSYPPQSGLSRQWTQGTLKPWDGVWRGVASQGKRVRPTSVEDREERRRQIEQGLR